jgi:hypothetical protein
MWKLIKSSYSATRELVSFLGEGKDLLVEGLDEFNKSMETFNAELKSKNTELLETGPFKHDIHKLKLCKLTIEQYQQSTPTRYEDLHRYYDSCKGPINAIINFIQIAIDQPHHRHLVQDIVNKVKTEIAAFPNEDEECKIELEEMYSTGLDKNSNFLEAFYYFLEFYSNDELEKKVKPMLPGLIQSFNSSTKKIADVTLQLKKKV